MIPVVRRLFPFPFKACFTTSRTNGCRHHRRLMIVHALAWLGLFLASPTVQAQAPKTASLAHVAEQVNQRMVKLFGIGGYKGITAYGTGIVVSSDGYVLTAASPMLDTADLLIHLADGRRVRGKVVVTEPELDAALVKIDKVDDLPFFDVSRAAKLPLAQPGDWILAFSNQFEIATREEPMSVQHGVIAAYNKLKGRHGIFERLTAATCTSSMPSRTMPELAAARSRRLRGS